MKAQIVPAVILTQDDGKVTDVFFSQELAEVILGIQYEYAQDEPDGGDKKRQEIAEARTVVQSAGLPEKSTSADGHYCAVKASAEGLRLTEEQLEKRNGDAVPKEHYPGYALCCFIRGGRHGLRLAFSREAAKQMLDEPGARSYGSLEPHKVEAVKGMIDKMALPFPNGRVQLDDELDNMLRSMARTHR